MFLSERRLEARVGERRLERRDERRIDAQPAARAQHRSAFDEQRSREHLQRFPAIERVGIVRREEAQVLGRHLHRDLDRRAKAAIERRDRPLGSIRERQCLRGMREERDPALDAASVCRHQR